MKGNTLRNDPVLAYDGSKENRASIRLTTCSFTELIREKTNLLITMRRRLFRLTAILILTAIAGMGMQAFGQNADVSAVSAGEYDNGKMWTFDYPPVQHFRDTYDFEPGEAWFVKARLGSLRLPNCTASFVSRSAMVITLLTCAAKSSRPRAGA